MKAHLKARLIESNLVLSIIALGIDPDKSGITVVIAVFGYFAASVILFLYAEKRGWVKS